MISPEEMQRRREHVRTALAENRLEGIMTTSPETQAVLDAYIRGEIEAADLVTAYKEGRFTACGCSARSASPRRH